MLDFAASAVPLGRMDIKRNMDLAGAGSLIAFALLLAFNQVVIKVVNEGLQPVFFAAIRSLGGAICMYVWIRFRGGHLNFQSGTILWGLILGVVFSIEFIGLFVALDLTSVVRTSIIFYSMPLWLAVASHFLLPGERIHRVKGFGLILAFGGVAWAIADRGAGTTGQASLLGDFAALLGAWGWMSVALLVRLSPLRHVGPRMQNFWQLSVSAPILFVAALWFGPFVRVLEPIHIWGLAFQIFVIVSAGFLFWIWLLTIYRAADVAAFSFLSPVFGILLGWALLGEDIGPSILIAGALVAIGIILINRPAPTAAKG